MLEINGTIIRIGKMMVDEEELIGVFVECEPDQLQENLYLKKCIIYIRRKYE